MICHGELRRTEDGSRPSFLNPRCFKQFGVG